MCMRNRIVQPFSFLHRVSCSNIIVFPSTFQVLLEFKEYATEVDVDFVRKAVRAIGRCAIKLERAAERCISVLLELIKIKVNYVVQEAIIVIKDIFRRYPNTYVTAFFSYLVINMLFHGLTLLVSNLKQFCFLQLRVHNCYTL